MREIFEDIPGFAGLYQASNAGRIKSLSRNTGNQYKNHNRILRLFRNRNGYLIAALCKNGEKYRFSVQRLVAITFIPNIDNKPCVHHINHCKIDNRCENLIWVTHSENVKFEYSTGGRIGKTNMKGKLGKDNPCSVKVSQLDLDGNLIKTHDGISEAARSVGGSASHIIKVCKGKLKKHKQSIWAYV